MSIGEEHEALRDRVIALAHRTRATVKTGRPQSEQNEAFLAEVDALDALDAWLQDDPAVLAKYQALWAAIQAKW